MLISSIQHTCVFSRYLSLLSGTHSLPDCFVLMPDLPVLIFGQIPWYRPCLFLTSLVYPRPGKLPYLPFDLVSAFSQSGTVCLSFHSNRLPSCEYVLCGNASMFTFVGNVLLFSKRVILPAEGSFAVCVLPLSCFYLWQYSLPSQESISTPQNHYGRIKGLLQQHKADFWALCETFYNLQFLTFLLPTSGSKCGELEPMQMGCKRHSLDKFCHCHNRMFLPSPDPWFRSFCLGVPTESPPLLTPGLIRV